MSGNSVEEKIGYLQGTMTQVLKRVEESREDVLAEFTKLYEQLGDHTREDKDRFGSMGKQIEEIRAYQEKQKWWLAGATGVMSLVITVVMFSDKLKSLVPGLFGP